MTSITFKPSISVRVMFSQLHFAFLTMGHSLSIMFIDILEGVAQGLKGGVDGGGISLLNDVVC